MSVDHPLYNDLGLEQLVALYRRSADPDPNELGYVFFDEVQYLRAEVATVHRSGGSVT